MTREEADVITTKEVCHLAVLGIRDEGKLHLV